MRLGACQRNFTRLRFQGEQHLTLDDNRWLSLTSTEVSRPRDSGGDTNAIGLNVGVVCWNYLPTCDVQVQLTREEATMGFSEEERQLGFEVYGLLRGDLV